MKSFILLASLSLAPLGLLADDLKKEKKIIIETIKANYMTWQVEQSSIEFKDLPDSCISEQSAVSDSTKKSQNNVKAPPHIFSDFSFKISESQAVVRFQVDFRMISAFMEKKDNQWKLVCAAEIPLDL